jgi:hypothetical protein
MSVKALRNCEIKMRISAVAIDSILQAEDIEGLLSLGAPNDEYSHEAAQMQSALETLDDCDVTEDHVSRLIMEVWAQSFGPFSDDDIKKDLQCFSG